MTKTSFLRTRFMLAMVSLLLPAFMATCSGPQPLARAIVPQDEQDYIEMMSTADQTPAQAFLARRAVKLGVSVEEARQRDNALSNNKNPFKARHDPSAVSRGAVIYKHECMTCHGEKVDGRGPTLPVPLKSLNFHRTGLRFDITMRGGAASKWFKTIRAGTEVQAKDAEGNPITIKMPNYLDRLSKEQVWLVVTYLQSLDADIPKNHTPDSAHDIPTL